MPPDRIASSRKPRQVERTRKWIEAATVHLAKTGPYRELTITAICKKAGVGRPTFYRHYESKEDVIRSIVNRALSGLFDEIRNLAPEDVTVHTINLATLKTWRNNKKFLELAKIPEIRDIAMTEADRNMSFLTETYPVYRDMPPLLRAYRYWGMKGVFFHWIEEDMRTPPEEIHKLLTSRGLE